MNVALEDKSLKQKDVLWLSLMCLLASAAALSSNLNVLAGKNILICIWQVQEKELF